MTADLLAARREITMWSETLEQRVAAKTEELEHVQRQIMHMEKMASLGKLSATVAHELNNPMSGMLTYARLVKREIADQPQLSDDVREELDRYLSLLANECNRCGEIVRNLLTFARRDGSRMSSVSAADIIHRSMMLVRHHFEMNSVRLEGNLQLEDEMLIADADQLQQALIALLVNALEATQDAHRDDPVVLVRARDERDGVVIEIVDNGVGVAEDDVPHLFEPFFSTKSEDRHGVGLGLAVVYGIAHRHQGVIEVDSAEGEGATFRLRLPREPVDSPDDKGDAGGVSERQSSTDLPESPPSTR